MQRIHNCGWFIVSRKKAEVFIIYFPTLTLICLRNIVSVHSVPNVFSLSFLNPMDGEAYSPWGRKGSDTTE